MTPYLGTRHLATLQRQATCHIGDPPACNCQLVTGRFHLASHLATGSNHSPQESGQTGNAPESRDTDMASLTRQRNLFKRGTPWQGGRKTFFYKQKYSSQDKPPSPSNAAPPSTHCLQIPSPGRKLNLATIQLVTCHLMTN